MSVNIFNNNLMPNPTVNSKNRSLDNILFNRGNFLKKFLNISFLTFNVRGLNELSKSLFIRDYLLEKNIGICFLQETHIDCLKVVDHLESVFITIFAFLQSVLVKREA
jgi:hypothetical protein